MRWLLVILALVLFAGLAVLAWVSKRAADRQRRLWSDEEVRPLQRSTPLAVPIPANDHYPEVWPTERSRPTR